MKTNWLYTGSALLCILVISVAWRSSDKEISGKSAMSDDFTNYWYQGEAEITSYELEQARYGEIHKGNAVMIFVTEDFSSIEQVKADKPAGDNVSVLKLNTTKNFNTGIYPYSMMTSSFLPVEGDRHALKLTNSNQEWCGHTYMQLNNRKMFEIDAYSYFQSEGDQHLVLEKNWLEDELWSKLRLNPDKLPTGSIQLIPSFFYLRLMHKELKSYTAEIERKDLDNKIAIYTIHYPTLNRRLTIHYKKEFPYAIEGWEESYISGWGKSAKELRTKAKKIKRIKSDYWNKNGVKDTVWRGKLGL